MGFAATGVTVIAAAFFASGGVTGVAVPGVPLVVAGLAALSVGGTTIVLGATGMAGAVAGAVVAAGAVVFAAIVIGFFPGMPVAWMLACAQAAVLNIDSMPL